MSRRGSSECPKAAVGGGCAEFRDSHVANFLPSTLRVCPLMKPASSEARKSTGPTRSSGSSSRPRALASALRPEQPGGECVSKRFSDGYPGRDDIHSNLVSAYLPGQRSGDPTMPALAATTSR
jgi:hypothetical protein